MGAHNPLRYRGYVYDTETALYYLQSRYYDPDVGRFINADAYASTGQGFIGNNMFAYCLNNPVNGADNNGKSSDSYAGWIGELIGVFIYELITGEDHPQQQIEAIENQVIQEQNKMIADAADAFWDAFEHSVELEMERQYQQDMAVKGFIENELQRWEEDPAVAIDFAFLTIDNVGTYAGYIAFVTNPTFGAGVLLVTGLAGGIWGALRYFGIN